MAGSTISGTVTSTVTLGSVSYPSPLTVTSTGIVAAAAYSATGIYGPAGSGTLINDGSVTGGVGSGGGGLSGGKGGIGVSLLGGTTTTNDGEITGGSGGDGSQNGGTGGVGVYLAVGAALTNQATIIGGTGGVFLSGGPIASDGLGGAGVLLDGGTLANNGAIIGGYGPGGSNSEGSGVILLAGTLINSGTVAGGTGLPSDNDFGAVGGRYGSGVYLAAGATLINDGTIVGGYNKSDGGSGIFVAAGGTLTITGVVVGGGEGIQAGSGVELSDGGSLDNIGTVTGGAGNSGAGILLAKGGTLANAATIIGGAGIASPSNSDQAKGGNGVVLGSGGVLINAAFISGGSETASGTGGGDGIYVGKGGTATNDANATITGGAGDYGGGSVAEYGGGAGASLVGGTLTNAGTITGGGGGVGLAPSNLDGNGGIGVSLTAGAMVTNTGSIGGSSAGYNQDGAFGGSGVVMGSSTTASTLVNFGIITGGTGVNVAPGASYYVRANTVGGGDGAYVESGGTLINHGTIIGGTGVYIGAGGAFTDNSVISGGDGVTLGSAVTTQHLGIVTVTSGGFVQNLGTVINGVGVSVAAGGTLTTGGTVSGGSYGGVTADAVLFAAAGSLVVDPGVTFVGQVAGNVSFTDDLYLGFGSGTGTLSGIGTQIVNFAQITVGAGANWTLTGANTIASGTGLTVQSDATLAATGTLENDGSILLDPSTMTVAALTGTGSVAIEAGSSFTVQGTIAGGETLTFGGIGAYLHLDAPDSVAGGITNFISGETIDLKGIDPSTVEYTSGQLTFAGGGDIPLALGNGGTVFASSSADGAEVTVLCFCANTLILTPSGERPVQELSVGDLVTTHRGEARPIVWIGVGKVLTTRGQRTAATPVIVRKGALAENVPNRDLRVTRGHAFWFGGGLIPVEYLVNHRSIEWDDRAQEVSLYHIELASHDVLVANGAPAESYRDDGNRWLFRNANSGWDLPPQPPCAPVLTGGGFVDAVWRRLLERAGPRPGFAVTDDPDLHLHVDGARLDAGARRGTAYIFALPARPVSVRIVSRSAAPAELGLARDPRVLGVALRRIVLRQGTWFHVIEAADGVLTEGFHPYEHADGLRWTDGDSALPEALFQDFDGPLELVLHVGGMTWYPLFGPPISYAAAA